MWEQLVEIDQDIFRFINSLEIGRFQEFWLFITQIRYWIPLYFLFFYLLYRYHKRNEGWLSIGALLSLVAITLFLTDWVKNMVERLRPNNEPMLMDSIIILQKPENFSFWSGHSAVSFAITTFVVFCLKRQGAQPWIYLFYLWPILFALSRIFVGVHYPADISVGMLVGLTLGYVGCVLFYKILDQFKLRDSRSDHP
ncbi:phosphatase PAP2 family protein [Nonlabens xiamenensis]|uniref:phosphatase PAP2 family protein n=1 Tax=Nonlabens xiamenensis TaxID=2341043 RepID=UPI000F60FBFF|nr:phosphatase PAP2 family protein [Nonlabens xiamenensis]